MADGDALFMGPRTNAEYEHSLVRVADERVLNRQAGAVVGDRMSLCFRSIANEMARDELEVKIRQSLRAREQRDDKKTKKREGGGGGDDADAAMPAAASKKARGGSGDDDEMEK